MRKSRTQKIFNYAAKAVPKINCHVYAHLFDVHYLLSVITFPQTAVLSRDIFVPGLSRKRGTLKLIRSSVCPSIGYKNVNLAHVFWHINDRALIFGIHDPCDKPFLLLPCGDLDLWSTSRSNLLPGGDHKFSNLLVRFINNHPARPS